MRSPRLSPHHHKLRLALGLLGPALAANGCESNAQHAALPSGTGGLGLQLQLSSEVTVGSITYQLLHESEFVRSGTFVPGPDSDIFAGFIGQLPQASGYQLSLDTNAMFVAGEGTTRCHGDARFGIVRGKTTTVAIRMRCEGVRGDALTDRTTPEGNSCPSISLLLAQPATARIGEPISVTGEAVDSDMMPKALSYRWSTSNGNGSFTSTVDAATMFVCSSIGHAELALVVSDGDPNCPFEQSRVKVACETSPNTANAGNAGASGSAGSAGATTPVAGAQAPSSTAGQGATTSPQAPSAGTHGNPAFDAGTPGMEPPIDPPDDPDPSESDDPPPSDPEEDPWQDDDGEEDPAPSDPEEDPWQDDDGEEDPTPSDPEDPWPNDDGEGAPVPPPWEPWLDAGQPSEPERPDHERDAGKDDRDRDDRDRDDRDDRDRPRQRDAGWPRDQGGDGASGHGGSSSDSPPPAQDDQDAGPPP